MPVRKTQFFTAFLLVSAAWGYSVGHVRRSHAVSVGEATLSPRFSENKRLQRRQLNPGKQETEAKKPSTEGDPIDPTKEKNTKPQPAAKPEKTDCKNDAQNPVGGKGDGKPVGGCTPPKEKEAPAAATPAPGSKEAIKEALTTLRKNFDENLATLRKKVDEHLEEQGKQMDPAKFQKIKADLAQKRQKFDAYLVNLRKTIDSYVAQDIKGQPVLDMEG